MFICRYATYVCVVCLQYTGGDGSVTAITSSPSLSSRKRGTLTRGGLGPRLHRYKVTHYRITYITDTHTRLSPLTRCTQYGVLSVWCIIHACVFHSSGDHTVALLSTGILDLLTAMIVDVTSANVENYRVRICYKLYTFALIACWVV